MLWGLAGREGTGCLYEGEGANARLCVANHASGVDHVHTTKQRRKLKAWNSIKYEISSSYIIAVLYS
jgi:hypothetical protein